MGETLCSGCSQPTEPSWRYCSRCGHPTGAFPPTAKSSAVPVWLIVIVLLIFLGVPVTGIIAAIAIPNFVQATQKAKAKRTMADIRMVATAIEAYAVDNNTYPPYGSSLEDVERLISPTYIREMPKTDGWNREIRYHCLDPSGESCAAYAFQSAGKDGLFEDLSYEIEPEVTTNYDCDILYANGEFVWYPESRDGGR